MNNDIIVDGLKTIRNDSELRHYACLMMYEKYNKRYNWLSVGSIVFSTLSTMIYGVQSNMSPEIFTITGTIISFMSTVCAGILKFTAFKEKADQFNIASQKYLNIRDQINTQIIVDLSDQYLPDQDEYDRDDEILFYKWATKTYEDIIQSTVPIEEDFLKKSEDFLNSPQLKKKIIKISDRHANSNIQQISYELSKINNNNEIQI